MLDVKKYFCRGLLSRRSRTLFLGALLVLADHLGSEGGKLDELGLWEHLAVLDEGSPIEDGKCLIKFWTSLEW